MSEFGGRIFNNWAQGHYNQYDQNKENKLNEVVDSTECMGQCDNNCANNFVGGEVEGLCKTLKSAGGCLFVIIPDRCAVPQSLVCRPSFLTGFSSHVSHLQKTPQKSFPESHFTEANCTWREE